MAGLGRTTAALKRWRNPVPGGASAERRAGRLIETVGFGANPGGLRMLTHAPAGLGASPALVVVLHGCTQTAEGYAEGSGWLSLADRHGFIVLAPEQTGANNQNRCFNWFQGGDIRRGGGEAASIAQMVERAVVTHGVDRRRVFVTGLSAGGAMTSVMLATYPDVFAGGAVIAGLPFGAATSVQDAFGAMFQGRSRSGAEWGEQVRSASTHRGPWPSVAIWHGDQDTTVVPGNAEESLKQWLDVHGLKGAPDGVTVSGRHTHRVWTDASGRALVESHGIQGLGHGTPLATTGDDGCGAAGPFLLEAAVSSSREIARSWSLLTDQPRRVTGSRPAAEPATRAPERPGFAHAQGGPATDVKTVIERALAAAGLRR